MERKKKKERQTWIMEHYDHVICGYMDVCEMVTDTMDNSNAQYRSRCLQCQISFKCQTAFQYNTPSAPSRIAASKLASVFSGNRAEAPRWPQQSTKVKSSNHPSERRTRQSSLLCHGKVRTKMLSLERGVSSFIKGRNKICKLSFD